MADTICMVLFGVDAAGVIPAMEVRPFHRNVPRIPTVTCGALQLLSCQSGIDTMPSTAYEVRTSKRGLNGRPNAEGRRPVGKRQELTMRKPKRSESRLFNVSALAMPRNVRLEKQTLPRETETWTS